MFKPVPSHVSFPRLEEEILKFWQDQNTFQKSLEIRQNAEEFVFFDGPPFATGLPHYGHILAGTMKDVIPRYKTMRGYLVNRRFGWDCHGLPVENLIEKELNLSDKKAIQDFGEDNFNEACRSSVDRYVNEWEKTVDRMGRWADYKHAYHTMDLAYMESVWWVFGELWKKGLVYQGLKPMHICPRCETPLSNFEVNQSYQDLTDQSVSAKFKIRELENTYIIAWTTTPWTLAGNAALALNPEFEYGFYSNGSETLVLATVLSANYENELAGYELSKTISGQEILNQNWTYHPLISFYESEREKGGFRVVGADFVTLDTGSGIVHIAPAFGEEDLELSYQQNIPAIKHVSMGGHFNTDLQEFLVKDYPEWKDLPIKTNKDNRAFDEQILKYLGQKGL
nr:class I tRNA ligase family protein [Candidatus Gracilibacteria bacterium]